MILYRLITGCLSIALFSNTVLASQPDSSKTSKALLIVNKETITQSDLDQRLKLLNLTGGFNHQGKVADNLKAEILKSLIQEKLQLQAAKQKKINVVDKDVDNVLANMAKENNMSLQNMIDMLSKNNIQKETLAGRIRAQMAWSKYLRVQYAPLIHVGETEVDKALDKIKNRKDQKQYLISEITLLVSDPTQSSRVLSDANKIISDLKNGANFVVIAQQLSKGPSAPHGGDLGWISLDQVDPSVAHVIEKLAPGSLSAPIRTAAGYKIIKVRDVRHAGEADPGETEVSLCQVLFPIRPDSSEADLMQVSQQVQETLDCNGCNNFKSKAKQFGFEIQETQKVKLNQLPEQLRQMARTSTIGKCTQPAMTPEGLVGTMVCNKTAANFILPSREDIMADLEQEKLAKHSMRELKRLEATASFDFKDESCKQLLGM